MAKDSMLPIESLERSLKKRFPDAQISVDRPRKASGVWFLDITQADHPVIVQWQRGNEFGINSSAEHAYGGRADEAVQEQDCWIRFAAVIIVWDEDNVFRFVTRLAIDLVDEAGIRGVASSDDCWTPSREKRQSEQDALSRSVHNDVTILHMVNEVPVLIGRSLQL